MGDDSRKSVGGSLKHEWALLWETLSGEGPTESENPFETGKVRALSLDDVKRLTRELSQDRRKLNRRLESLNKELELNTAKLESVRLVGGEDDDTVRKIGELNEQGQKVSHALADLDGKLRRAREHEDQLRRRLTPA